jgi:hypothetical protein
MRPFGQRWGRVVDFRLCALQHLDLDMELTRTSHTNALVTVEDDYTRTNLTFLDRFHIAHQPSFPFNIQLF